MIGRATGKSDFIRQIFLSEVRREAKRRSKRKMFVKKYNLQIIVRKLKSELKCK